MQRHLAYGLPLEELDVILVDDHRGTQAMLRSMLSAFRVKRIRAFDNAADALRAMAVEPPSVVLTDWEMRPVDGISLLKVMRRAEMAPLCLVPAIMISGHASLGMVEKAFSAGIHHMLVKPISPAALLERLSWLTQDDRQMVKRDGSWHIDGLEEVVEKRIEPLRRNGLLRQKTMQKDSFLSGPQADPKVAVDKYQDEDAASREPVEVHRVRRSTNRRNASWRGWRL